MRSKQTDLSGEIQRLKSADLTSLQLFWRSHLRRPFPDHLPRHLIVSLLAWQLQADRFGGLSKDEEKYLADVGAKPGGAPVGRYSVGQGRHQLGTVFVREHGGAVHRVMKTADGYEWQGRGYGSLSAVAFAITGTNWNGYRFFGVTPPRRKRGD